MLSRHNDVVSAVATCCLLFVLFSFGLSMSNVFLSCSNLYFPLKLDIDLFDSFSFCPVSFGSMLFLHFFIFVSPTVQESGSTLRRSFSLLQLFVDPWLLNVAKIHGASSQTHSSFGLAAHSLTVTVQASVCGSSMC